MITDNDIFENLMIDYLSGSISEKDEITLFNLLESDEKHQTQFREMAQARAFAFAPALESEKQSNYEMLKKKLTQEDIDTTNYEYTPKRHTLKRILQIAAIFVLMLTTSISSYFLYLKFSKKQSLAMVYQTIVPNGSKTKLILPDGSVVWLNSGSEFKYDNSFGLKERRVMLNGEGYFEVAKDKTKPFIVITDNIKIKVLGTVFNVDSYSEKATEKVDLLEGKVDVSLLDTKVPESQKLLPNEMVIYNKDSKKITKTKSPVSKSTQWMLGKLTFTNESLENILIDLERKFDVRFVIETGKIKSEFFSGSLDLNLPLNVILDYIDVDRKMEITYKGNDIYISDRKKIQ
ncbi:MAG: FecR family protein [Paludibacteraceae bacterium]